MKKRHTYHTSHIGEIIDRQTSPNSSDSMQSYHGSSVRVLNKMLLSHEEEAELRDSNDIGNRGRNDWA